MKKKEHFAHPEKYFKSIRKDPDTWETYGETIHREGFLDKPQAACIYAIVLAVTNDKILESSSAEEYFRQFFTPLFDEKLNIHGSSYYKESVNYLSRTFDHLRKADTYKELLASYHPRFVEGELSHDIINFCVLPFKEAPRGVKLTFYKSALIAFIFSDDYSSERISYLRYLRDKLKLDENDAWTLLTMIFKGGSISLKDVKNLSEKDKFYVYITMIKDLFENDGEVDEDELAKIEIIRSFIGLDSTSLIECKNYVRRSFILSETYQDKDISVNDSELIVYLTLRVLEIDGVRDKEEIDMLKNIMSWLNFDSTTTMAELSRKYDEATNILNISKENRLFALLMILQMILADEVIHKYEKQFLYEQVKLLLKNEGFESNDDDFLCFLEILYLNQKWISEYKDFFQVFQQLYTRHIKKKEDIVERVVSVYHFIQRQKSFFSLSKDFVPLVSDIFEFEKSEKQTLNLFLGGTKRYLNNIGSDDEHYLIVSFIFILKNLIENMNSSNIDNSNEVLEPLINDINQNLQITKYHIDTYKFLMGWTY